MFIRNIKEAIAWRINYLIKAKPYVAPLGIMNFFQAPNGLSNV